MYDFTYIWDVKNIILFFKQRKKQNNNRLIEPVNKLMVARGERFGDV